MKRKFVITEVASYTVEAETIAKAEALFLDGYINSFPCDVSGREIEAPDPNPVKVGDQVNVDAHEHHDEDFSGVVVANDGLIEGRIQVKAPDSEIYDCDADYVYVPEPPDQATELQETIDQLKDALSAGDGDGKAGPGEIEELEEEIKELKAQLARADDADDERCGCGFTHEGLCED